MTTTTHSRGIWTRALGLGLGGAAGFWVTNFAISLTPIAAEYRAALGISYLPMLAEALLAGLIIGIGVSACLLRFNGTIPTRSPILKAVFLSLIALTVATILVEIAPRLLTTTNSAPATSLSPPPSTHSGSSHSASRSAIYTAEPRTQVPRDPQPDPPGARVQAFAESAACHRATRGMNGIAATEDGTGRNLHPDTAWEEGIGLVCSSSCRFFAPNRRTPRSTHRLRLFGRASSCSANILHSV